MTEKEQIKRALRVGDIVKTPNTGGLYHDLPAIVTAKAGLTITVHTGRAELVYEADQLRSWGAIRLGRSYGVSGGKRFRVCVYTGLNGATEEIHVCIRDAGALGEETRALEVRKLAFAALNVQRDSTTVPA